MFMIGYILRAIRTEQRLSKRELGEICGVTEWAIRDIERGGLPSVGLLKRLRDTFRDLSYDQLLGDSDYMSRDELHQSIAMVNSALAAGRRVGVAQDDLKYLVEQLHTRDCLAEQTQAQAATRRRQLQEERPASTRRR